MTDNFKTVDSETCAALVKQRALTYRRGGEHGGDWVDAAGKVLARWLGGMAGPESSADEFVHQVAELPKPFWVPRTRSMSESELYLLNRMLLAKRNPTAVGVSQDDLDGYCLLPETRELYERCLRDGVHRVESSTVYFMKLRAPREAL